MKNHFDKNGNYINIENLSLAEIYNRGYQDGSEDGLKGIRPHGKWIYKEFDAESGISRSYWCSNCGEPKSQWCDDFCQRCGADMRKVVRNETN